MAVNNEVLRESNTSLQFASPQARAAQQWSLLHEQIEYVARESGFFHRVFDEAGIESIASAEEFATVPFTEKDDLRSAQDDPAKFGSLTCVDRSRLSRICSTSGTTGRPLYYSVTRDDKECVYLGWESLYTAAGFTAADLALYAFALGGPYGSAFGGEAMERSAIPTLPIGAGAAFERFRLLIEDLHPSVLVGITNFPVRLGQKFRDAGVDPASLGIEKVMVGGEPAAAFRDSLTQDWDAEVYEVMGMGEFGMIWGECSARKGMHYLTPEFTYVEFIDEETGASTLSPEAGRTYELVYSSLHREAMPILRYRSHDLVEIIETNCACGRTTPTIRAIGRTDDMIKVRGVNLFPAGVEFLLASFGERVRSDFQIVLPASGERKYSSPLELVVACDEPESGHLELSAELAAYFRAHLNVQTIVHLVGPDELAGAVRGGLGRRDYFRIASS